MDVLRGEQLLSSREGGRWVLAGWRELERQHEQLERRVVDSNSRIAELKKVREALERRAAGTTSQEEKDVSVYV